MKLSCEKCKKVFVLRNYDVKDFKAADFICPECRSPLRKTKQTNNLKVMFTSVKNLLTEEAANKIITKKLFRLYKSLQEAKSNSMNWTIAE